MFIALYDFVYDFAKYSVEVGRKAASFRTIRTTSVHCIVIVYVYLVKEILSTDSFYKLTIFKQL